MDIVSIFRAEAPAYNSVPGGAPVPGGSNPSPLRSEGPLHRFTISLHGCFPIVSTVRTLPIAVALPLRQKHVEIRRCKVNGAVEFDLVCFLRSLDLSIQMRQGRPVETKFDSIFFQAFPDNNGKEFYESICFIIKI